ncbi:hypothetical protein Tco_0858655 [Tanacetum coccineum]|uniref:Uncharacterized protein n=1 Tax=Tanacetum coccineum TaxID=301880 RepID=A0ABQ5BDR8_9ASTR
MANRMAGLKTVDRWLPYARLLTRLFEVAKNKHPNSNHFQNCKSVDPIIPSFKTYNLNITVKHGTSSSHAQLMNTEEQIESETNSWFEETTWSEAEREISPDKVLRKEEEENLSFGDRMDYKSYLSTKRQHRESRTKISCTKTTLKGNARTQDPRLGTRGSNDLGVARAMREKESKAKKLIESGETQAITGAKRNNVHGSSKAM